MAKIPCDNGELLKGLATPTRNKYFYGKLMDAHHFDLEQDYFNRKRWLINQLGLCYGVLCGLQVAPTNDGKQVIVGPGVAIDKLGREIVVPAASQPVDPRQPTDACGWPSGDRITGAETVHLCLAFHECEGEPVPVLVGDCDTREGCAHSLIFESYRILVRKGAPPETKPTCGFENPFPSGQPAQFYSQLVSRVSQPFAEPQGDPCVVLTQITLPDGDAEITDSMIDLNFRPVVYSNGLLFELLLCLAQQAPTPTPVLTTINMISWDHDGVVPLDTFMNGMTVTFSDNVQASPIHGDALFVVTVEYLLDGVSPILQPPLLPGSVFVQRVFAQNIVISGNTASFQPASAFIEALRAISGTIGEPLCRVVLKCDAITDANGLAVDGNFLSGVFPSGNGSPGGNFESWFTLNLGV